MYPTIYWGDLLRDLRTRHYMLQKEVAILLHISRQSYSNIENGRTQPTPEQLSALSYVYGVNLLDYVRKCLPQSFIAELMAYRTIQTRRVYEIQLEEEEKTKHKSKSSGPDRKKHEPVPEPENPSSDKPETATYDDARNDPESGQSFVAEPSEYGAGAPLTASSIPVRERRKKRDPAVQYHNTSNMSSIELLMSGKYPRSPGIDANAFLGRFDFEKKEEVPKKKKGRPKKDKTSKKETPEGPADVSVPPAKDSPVPEIKTQGPMPPDLLRELFPPESPYTGRSI